MELVLPARKIRGPRVLCCNIKLSSVSKDGIYENSLGLYIYAVLKFRWSHKNFRFFLLFQLIVFSFIFKNFYCYLQ